MDIPAAIHTYITNKHKHKHNMHIDMQEIKQAYRSLKQSRDRKEEEKKGKVIYNNSHRNNPLPLHIPRIDIGSEQRKKKERREEDKNLGDAISTVGIYTYIKGTRQTHK